MADAKRPERDRLAEAVQSVAERLVRIRSHGVARPPRWLLLGYHYLATPCMPPGKEAGGGGVYAPQRFGTVADIQSRVRAVMAKRRTRGYDRVHLMAGD